MQRRLLWGIAGLMSYLGAAIILAIAVTPLFEAGSPRAMSLEPTTIGLLVSSALLFGLGGMCLRRASIVASGSPKPVGGAADGSLLQGGAGGPPDDSEEVRCQHCGVANDAFFTYCEECAGKL